MKNTPTELLQIPTLRKIVLHDLRLVSGEDEIDPNKGIKQHNK